MPPLRREELIRDLLKEIDPNKDPGLYNDTRQAFERATDDQLFTWYNQQNDPGQLRETGRDAIGKDIESSVRKLDRTIEKTLDHDEEEQSH